MIRYLSIILLCLVLSWQSKAQQSSILILGDLYYDLIEDHDLHWLATKPVDLRQVTTEYTVCTMQNWYAFIKVLQFKNQTVNPSVKAVIQMGDLSEGLAGSVEKSKK